MTTPTPGETRAAKEIHGIYSLPFERYATVEYLAKIIHRAAAEEKAAMEAERNALFCANRELRAINVMPGISLGLAQQWRQGRQELVEALKAELEQADGCEINPANYDHADICHLNDGYVSLFEGVERALAKHGDKR